MRASDSRLVAFRGELAKPQFATALHALLPKSFPVERFQRMAFIAVAENSGLLDHLPSLLTSCLKLAMLGLEPNTPLRHATLITRRQSVRRDGEWTKEPRCSPQVMYQGWVQLLLRAGVRRVDSGVVREGDEFAFLRGTEQWLRHVPAGDPGREMSHVWALAVLPSGDQVFTVMTRAAIERHRDRYSDSYRGSAKDAEKRKREVWVTNFEEMAEKTAILQLVPLLPAIHEGGLALAVERSPSAGAREVSALLAERGVGRVDYLASEQEEVLAEEEEPQEPSVRQAADPPGRPASRPVGVSLPATAGGTGVGKAKPAAAQPSSGPGSSRSATDPTTLISPEQVGVLVKTLTGKGVALASFEVKVLGGIGIETIQDTPAARYEEVLALAQVAKGGGEE